MLSPKHRKYLQAIVAHSGSEIHQAACAQAVLDLHPLDSSTSTLPSPDLSHAVSWRAAARLVVRAHGAAGVPFSAGEVVLAIRSARPDLRFSCAVLTSFIADMTVTFDGRVASRITRHTDGSSRSLAGSRVVVYGPTDAAAVAHNFEVEIPEPPTRRKLSAAQPKQLKAAK